MKVFIPTIGSDLILSCPVTVTIHSESRNDDFMNKLGCEVETHYRSKDYLQVTIKDKALAEKHGVEVMDKSIRIKLAKDVTLRVNRIYIRQGAEDFDSVTFNSQGTGGLPKGRFWLKLSDVNEFEIYKPEDIKNVQAERKQLYKDNKVKNAQKLVKAYLDLCEDMKALGLSWEDVYTHQAQQYFEGELSVYNKTNVDKLDDFLRPLYKKPELKDYITRQRMKYDMMLNVIQRYQKGCDSSYSRKDCLDWIKSVKELVSKMEGNK